jgi:hypothetical protein
MILTLDNNDKLNEDESSTANFEETFSNEPFLGGKLDITLWSEILPNLWQGGTGDEDRIGDKHYQFDRGLVSIKKRHFDSVYTFYGHANPVDWLVKEFRYGFFDNHDTNFDMELLKRIVVAAHDDWKRGERVLIRCQAGLNRSGLICALVLIRDGYEPADAITLMREKRHEQVLFNPNFEDFLLNQDTSFWRD